MKKHSRGDANTARWL